MSTTQTFTSSTTWICPAGVFTVTTAECWGGGGSGGASGTNSCGGGGGGAYSKKNTIAVTPGTSYTVTVGAGGSDTAGGNTSFINTSTVLAQGGAAGSNLDNGVGGGGGAAGSGVGDTKFGGGNGGDGLTSAPNTNGGGGGSSAGTAAAGGNGANATSTAGGTGGLPPSGGGNGGDGGSTGAGVAGAAPGGAGGGSGGSSTQRAGAAGKVVIVYDVTPPSKEVLSQPFAPPQQIRQVASMLPGTSHDVGWVTTAIPTPLTPAQIAATTAQASGSYGTDARPKQPERYPTWHAQETPTLFADATAALAIQEPAIQQLREEYVTPQKPRRPELLPEYHSQTPPLLYVTEVLAAILPGQYTAIAQLQRVDAGTDPRPKQPALFRTDQAQEGPVIFGPATGPLGAQQPAIQQLREEYRTLERLRQPFLYPPYHPQETPFLFYGASQSVDVLAAVQAAALQQLREEYPLQPRPRQPSLFPAYSPQEGWLYYLDGFKAQALARGVQPVWLVEIPDAASFLATRAVTLGAQAYIPLITQGGIANITRELLADDTPRVSTASLAIVNPGLFSALLNRTTLDNRTVRLALGLLGWPAQLYRTLFQGPIDNWRATWKVFTIDALDGSFKHHVTLPAIPTSFFGATTNPADVIQLIIQTYLPTLTIDAPSFAAFRAARTAWSLTGDVDAGQLSLDLLLRLARQAQGRYFETPDGFAILRTLDSTASALQTFAARDVTPQSVQLMRSDIAQVYTDIFVYYARDPTLGGPSTLAAYTGVVSATPTGTTHPTEPLHILCAFGQTVLNGASHQLNYFADFIGTEAMAHQLLTFLVIWHTQRRYKAQFTTWLAAYGRDITDPVRVTHTLLPTRMQTRPLEVVTRQDSGPHIALTVQELAHPNWNYWVEHWGVVSSGANPSPAGVTPAIIFEPWEGLILRPVLILMDPWEAY